MGKAAKKEPAREKRINDDIVVDAYDAWEQAMGWYYLSGGQPRVPVHGNVCQKEGNLSLKLKEKEGILCTLTRNDQKGEKEFECDAYERKA